MGVPRLIAQASTSSAGATYSTTTTAPVNAGDTVVVTMHADGSAIPNLNSMTLGGNALSQLAAPLTGFSNTGKFYIWFIQNCPAVAVGATLQAVFSAAPGGSSFNAMAISGLKPAALDANPAGVWSEAATTVSISTGALAQASEVVIGAILTQTGAYTEASGFTTLTDYITADGIQSVLSYKIVSSTASVAYNPSRATSGRFGGFAASFKLNASAFLMMPMLGM